MKNWIDLGSDVCWEDHGGMWGRRAKDGKWFVLSFYDLWEATGDEALDHYHCSVKMVELASIPENEMARAIASMGDWVGSTEFMALDASSKEAAIVEICVRYGLGAPLDEVYGKRAISVRAQARRIAEGLMRDPSRLDHALDRPVNAIGSTAREYGIGNLGAAFDRARDARDPQITFGTLSQENGFTVTKRIRHSQFQQCPFKILVPNHYREDGSCKCDDAEERKRLIKTAGYEARDFKNIPLRA